MNYLLSSRRALLVALFLVALSSLMGPHTAQAAITAGTGTEYNDEEMASPLDVSVTVAAGSNIVLFVTLAYDGGSIDSITYNGVALTNLWSVLGNYHSDGWILVNPSTGSNTLRITFTGTTDLGVWAQPWYGVAQGNTVGTTWRTPVTDNDSGGPVEPSVTVSTALSGDMAIDMVASPCFAVTADASQTVQKQDIINCVNWGSSSELASGSTVMSWVQTGTDNWAIGATALIPTSGRSVLVKPPNNLGLVGYWSFDEGTSTQATDFSGNGNVGTFPGSSANPTWVNGKRGKALSFDGGDYIDVSSSAILSALQSDNSFTVSLWAASSVYSSSGGVIAIRNGTDANQLFLLYPYDSTGGNGARVFYNGGNTINQDSSTIAADGTYHHFLWISRSATDHELYVDGISVGTSATSKTLNSTLSNVTIGAWHPAVQFFNGKIDDIRVYNRALSASEVAALYNQGTAGAAQVGASSQTLQNGTTLGPANGLVGLWTFDGYDLTDKVYDRSGQGNNGYFVGGATSSAKAQGKLGQALNFISPVRVVVRSASGLPSVNAAQSMSAWYKSSDDTADLVVLRDTAGSAANTIALRPGEIIISDWGGGINLTAPIPAANQWHHVMWTTNGATGILYVDGVQVTSDNVTLQSGSGQQVVFANWTEDTGQTDQQYVGVLDDVRIYNRALTAAEVKQLYLLGQTQLRP